MTRPRVLMVDDEPAILKIGQRVLSEIGFDVDTAGDGQAGMDRVLQEKGAYEIVVSDMKMPKMEGLELLHGIKSHYSKIDVILMTGYPDLETAVEALKRGAYDYLLKPIDIDVLAACINRCWEKRQIADALDAEKSLRAELMAAYQELERAEYAKEAFMARVCHELRTPMTIVLGALEALPERAVKDERLLIDKARESALRLKDVIEALLLYSSFKKGEAVLQKAPVDIPALIKSCVALCRAVLENKKVSVVYEELDGLPLVAADSAKLTEVFKHLVINAAHFNSDGGRLTIRGEAVQDSLRLTFTDTGAGIPEDALPQVFSGFYQAADYLTRQVGGLGLGLAIVKRVVEAHGGSVAVQSAVGKGTTFHVRLPL